MFGGFIRPKINILKCVQKMPNHDMTGNGLILILPQDIENDKRYILARVGLLDLNRDLQFLQSKSKPQLFLIMLCFST